MFFNIKQNKIDKAARDVIIQTGRTMDEVMQQGEGTDQMLSRLGISRQQALAAVLADDEIESCKEDLRAAMQAQPWRIYGEGLSPDDNNRLWRTVQKHLPTLVEIVLTSKLNGYSVAQYVYTKQEDGYYDITRVYNRQGSLDRFVPKTDGLLYFDNEPVNTQVQFLFLANRPSDTQPAGEMTAARLYPAVCLRKQGFVYAAQFITRYAQPYLVSKNDSNTDEQHQSWAQRLYRLINGGAISISRDDDIALLQNNANGDAFKKLENLANARIQKMLLGKVRTGDLETGSRAAQETEQDTQNNRIDGYLSTLTQAVQHMIDALLLVNLAWGKHIQAPQGIWFEFATEEQIDIKRAERDKIYLDAGAIELTEAYYRDVIGYDEQHFKLKSGTSVNAKMHAKLSAQQANHGQSMTASQMMMQPKMQAVMQALAHSQDYADFELNLSKLSLDDGDHLLIQRLVGDGTHAWLRGEAGGENEPQ